MNEIIQNMLNRRSCRSFNGEPPAQEELEAIIEAGRWAPTGDNTQSVHFIVIQDHKTRSELRARVQSAFARMDPGGDLDISVQTSIRQSRMGLYAYDFHAPVVIIVANQRSCRNAMLDSGCAIENMMLAATSLGVGACWVSQLRSLSDHERIRGYLETLGLAPEECVCGGLALGHYDGQLEAPKPRTGMKVTWVLEK